MFGRLRLPALAAALTLCVGCAQRCCNHNHASQPISAEYGLPTVERSRIIGEVALASHAVELADASLEYRGLTAAEAQCLAVENSAIGKLLDRERWSSCVQHQHGKNRRARCLQLSVLRAASMEARNKSGADALKLYYGIAEVEAGIDAVDDGLTKIDEATAKIAQLKKQGVVVPFDATEFERRRITLESKRADLLATRIKLNTQLRTLLGFENHPGAPLLFPTDPLTASDEPIDVEVAVAYGLATRGELQVLRILACADPETATETIRSLLGEVHGLAGMALKAAACKQLLKQIFGNDCEPATRRNQVAELHRSRSDQLAGEIRAAVETVLARRRQAALAQEQVASWGRRIHELSQRRTTGDASFVELIQAELQEVESRNAVTAAVLELKRAEVTLRELQGALAAECCGIGAPSLIAASAEPTNAPHVEAVPAATIPHAPPTIPMLRQPEPPAIPQLEDAPPPPKREPTKVTPAVWQTVRSQSPPREPEQPQSPSAALFGPPPLGQHTSFTR
jgi:hypothetical protein